MQQTPAKSSLLKKLGLFFLSVIGLVVLFLATIPFWFNIDRYRPQLVAQIRPYFKGEIELGRLSLSFWGKFRVGVDGLELKDTLGNSLVAAKSMAVEIPVSSIWSGAPSMTFVLNSPSINVVKDEKKKINLLDLVKSPASTDQETKNSTEPSLKTTLDRDAFNSDFLTHAKVTVQISKARVVYNDLSTKSRSEVTSVNFVAKDISLSGQSQLKVSADLDTQLSNGWSLKGPLEILGVIKGNWVQEDSWQGSVALKSNLKELRIDSNGGYKKDRGIPGSFQAEFNRSQEAMTANCQFEIPGVDLEVKANLDSLEKPRGELLFHSKKIDLDAFWPKTNSNGTLTPTTLNASSKTSQDKFYQGKESLDKNVRALRENPWMNESDLVLKAEIREMKSKGIVISDVLIQGSFKKGLMKIDQAKLKVLEGSVIASAQVNLMSSLPTYTGQVEVKQAQLGQAVNSQSPLLKNTVYGKGYFKFAGSGSSFDPENAKSRFVGQGNFKIEGAKFSTLDVGQMVTQGLGQSMIKIIEKLPPLKGQSLEKVGSIKSEYEVMSADFTIAQGVFKAPRFLAKPVPNQGLELVGSTELDLRTCALKADWQIQDPYNLTRARDIKFEQGGFKVEHLLAEGNKPVVFPVQIGGTCESPKVNYEAMTTHFLKVALNNASKGAVQKATQEVGKKLQEELGKRAGQQLKDALKGIFGN